MSLPSPSWASRRLQENGNVSTHRRSPPRGGSTRYRVRGPQTLYGEAMSGWSLAAGGLTVSVTVPPNARGTVRLPGAALAAVTESGRSVASAPGVTRAAQAGEDVVVEVGSGRYRFGYDSARLAERLKPPPSPPAPGSNGL